MSKQQITGVILSILLAVGAAANAWSIHVYSNTNAVRNDMLRRIETIEKSYVTTAELKCIMSDVVGSQLNSFELRLQEKYRITPK